jgi:hypothetical protein
MIRSLEYREAREKPTVSSLRRREPREKLTIRSLRHRGPQSGVYVSRTLIATFAIVGAVALGWLGRNTVSGLAAALSGIPRSPAWSLAATSQAGPAQDVQPVVASSGSVTPATSRSTSSGQPTKSEKPNVYLTVVNAPGAPDSAPNVLQTSGSEPFPTTDGTTVWTTGASQSGASGGGSHVQVSGSNGSLRATSGTGSNTTPTRLIFGGGAAIVPHAPSTASTYGVGAGIALNLTPEMAATAIGEHIVIAYDGAIVYVGDYGSLTANSGDAVAGGTVALDAASSSFSSNYDPTVIVPNAGSSSGTTGTASASSATTYTQRVGGVMAGGSASAIPTDASPLVSAFISYTGNRTADIAGFEDHSILTRGMGNVVTYDDSNVFMNRDGKINANTGDTDSAGLNAIATLRSTVSAGPHCDDGCDDESIIQAEAGVFDEGDVAIDGDGHVVWSPDIVGASTSSNVDCNDPAETNDDGCDDSLPGDNGDDTDAADDESADGDVSDPEEPAETEEEADSTRPAADNGEEPDNQLPPGSLIVGGDGIDDLSERVDGNFNVSTYDDSNVVIGGSGAVNAQIGDSDTGGTVTMETVDSTVSGGISR